MLSEILKNPLKWLIILGVPLSFFLLLPSLTSTPPRAGHFTIIFPFIIILPIFSIWLFILLARKYVLRREIPSIEWGLLPLLSVIILSIMLYITYKTNLEAKIIAKDFAISQAKNIQKTCNNDSICPYIIEEWNDCNPEKNSVLLCIDAGNSIKYPLFYRHKNGDDQLFSLRLRYNSNEDLYLAGGINSPLKATYYTEGQKIFSKELQ